MTTFIRKHPMAGFYGIVILVGWISFAVIVGPKLLHGGTMTANDAFIMFPIIVLSVAVTGVACTSITRGKDGLANLRARSFKWRIGLRWYLLALLIPPSAVWIALTLMDAFHPGVFRPGFFPLGIVFGIFPGIFEEIGWTGFLLPNLLRRRSLIAAAIMLGALWSVWHLPVVNFLGAAGPHRSYFLQFALAFSGAMIAMRVLIVLIYSRTESILVAQVMHASSTGSLVVLSPPHISSGAEAQWYSVYAVILSLIGLAVYLTTRRSSDFVPSQVLDQ